MCNIDLQTTTTVSVTSTVTSILTCYSSLAANAAAPTACAVTGKKRRKRSIIDEEPPIELKNDIKIKATSLSANEGNFDDDIVESINPSQTVSETVAMMTSTSSEEVNVLEYENEGEIPLSIDLEVD